MHSSYGTNFNSIARSIECPENKTNYLSKHPPSQRLGIRTAKCTPWTSCQEDLLVLLGRFSRGSHSRQGLRCYLCPVYTGRCGYPKTQSYQRVWIPCGSRSKPLKTTVFLHLAFLAIGSFRIPFSAHGHHLVLQIEGHHSLVHHQWQQLACLSKWLGEALGLNREHLKTQRFWRRFFVWPHFFFFFWGGGGGTRDFQLTANVTSRGARPPWHCRKQIAAVGCRDLWLRASGFGQTNVASMPDLCLSYHTTKWSMSYHFIIPLSVDHIIQYEKSIQKSILTYRLIP